MAPSIPQTQSSSQHPDTNPSGLVEALDREAARMHAANHLARARETLVHNIQASGILKQVPSVQGEENIDSDPVPQAQVQLQPQPRPRPRIPAQVQAQWRGQEMQGLGILMGDGVTGENGHQSITASDEGRYRQEQEEAKQQRRVQVQQNYRQKQQQQGNGIEGPEKQGWERRDEDDGAYGSEYAE